MEYGIISSFIRNHMDENENSALEREEEKRRRAHQRVKVLKFPNFDDDDDDDTNCLRMSERDSGSVVALKHQEQDQEPGNYVLRENLKKTKRFVDSKELKVCKQCGKRFQSLKALCGHMASHSEKERVRSKFKEVKAVTDGHSDTESLGPKRRSRASKRRVRVKNVGGSVAELEQQEVAISLMLLSRDCGYKVGLNSVAESSSNNSVVLEARSSSMDVIISAKRREAKIVAKKDVRLLSKPDAEIGGSENSDSGYFRNGPKKNESDVSVEFKKLEVESGSGIDAKLVNGLEISDLGKGLIGVDGEEDKEDQEIRGSSKYELRKRAKNGNHKTEPLSGYHHYLDGSDHASQKKSKYECSTCNKTFASHTALGGHRASHAKANGGCGSICESGENSKETDTGKTPKTPAANAERKAGSKKSKGHECPICFRMFKSGQALGGHKRSHFVGGREVNSTTLIRQEEPTPEPEITVLLDLNLPAPMEEEEEADEDVGFMEW